MFSEAEFWVAVAFVLFGGILIYYRVHALILKSLDDRTARIKAELEEASRLKEEAQAVLVEFERKQSEAEREASDILAGAKSEVKRIAAEAKTKAEEFLVRRTKMADGKIAQAEAQALASVRAAAADAAVSTAEKILVKAMKGDARNLLVARSISDLNAAFNRASTQGV